MTSGSRARMASTLAATSSIWSKSGCQDPSFLRLVLAHRYAMSAAGAVMRRSPGRSPPGSKKYKTRHPRGSGTVVVDEEDLAHQVYNAGPQLPPSGVSNHRLLLFAASRRPAPSRCRQELRQPSPPATPPTPVASLPIAESCLGTATQRIRALAERDCLPMSPPARDHHASSARGVSSRCSTSISARS